MCLEIALDASMSDVSLARVFGRFRLSLFKLTRLFLLAQANELLCLFGIAEFRDTVINIAITAMLCALNRIAPVII